MYTTTRPCEYVCVFSIEVPTGEGTQHLFFALDVFSGLLMNTGIEISGNSLVVLQHITLLLMNHDFKARSSQGFTLVMPSYPKISDHINDMIQPHGGTLIFDDPYIAEISLTVTADFLHALATE